MDDRTIRSVFERGQAPDLTTGQEPSEIDLSPEDLEKVKQARDVMAALTKSFKAHRLYQPNNELLVRFQQEMVQKFRAFTERYTDLELRIRTHSFTLLGQPVYRAQEGENLAQLLYQDGFRRVSFHEGIPETELLAFQEILKKTAERSRELDFDAVTLFWEKDFKFITYHAVEDILPEGVDAAEAEAQANAQIERIQTLNYFPQEESGEMDAITLGLEEDKRQDIYDNEAPSEEVILKTQLVQNFLALAPAEIQQIRKEMASEKPEDLLLDMADVVLEVIYIERSLQDFYLLVETLEQILQLFLSFLDLDRTGEMFKRLRHLSEGYRKTSGKAADFVDQVIERSSGTDRLEPLFTALAQGHTFPIQSLGTFLLQLGSSAIPGICKTLAQAQSTDLRRSLCDVLVLIGRRDLPSVMTNVEDNTDQGLRNKIYILSRIQDERVLPYFRKLVQHPSGNVRQLVVLALSKFYNPVVRELLQMLLSDSDPAVRLNSLKVLAQSNDPKVLDPILALLQEAAFHQKEMVEKRAVFTTLATLGGDSLVESLGEILQNKNLKDPVKDDEIRICAAEALGLIGTDEAILLLQAGSHIKRKSVQQTCQEQLAKLQGGSAE